MVSIVLEKVTAMVVFTDSMGSPSEGEVEETVGAIVSVVVSSVVVSPLVPEASSILLESIPSSSDVICPQEFKDIPRRITNIRTMN